MAKMKPFGCIVAVVAALVLVFDMPFDQAQGEPATLQVVPETLHNAPLMFVENVGQVDGAVRFQVQGPGRLPSD